jgi:hypothetical protein
LEFRGQGLPPGDFNAFAPVDLAWLYFFTKLALSREALFESHTAILYDAILGMTIPGRPDGVPLSVDEERERKTENTNCYEHHHMLTKDFSFFSFRVSNNSMLCCLLLSRSSFLMAKFWQLLCRDIGKRMQM